MATALRFSRHASRRMQERQISHDEVAHVLANPEISYRSNENPAATVILGTAGHRRLKIIVRTDDPAYVITVARRDE